jgi:hypothetical protein
MMSESEMQAELERLRAENAQLKSKDKGGLSLKVSEKGGVSLYGMGRFPVTLYKEQSHRILVSAPEIEAFIRENDSKVKMKEWGVEERVQTAICCCCGNEKILAWASARPATR